MLLVAIYGYSYLYHWFLLLLNLPATVFLCTYPLQTWAEFFTLTSNCYHRIVDHLAMLTIVGFRVFVPGKNKKSIAFGGIIPLPQLRFQSAMEKPNISGPKQILLHHPATDRMIKILILLKCLDRQIPIHLIQLPIPAN